MYITLLLAKAHRGEKTHSVEEAQRGVTAKFPCGNNSTIPIYRYDVANLSLETPSMLNRNYIRVISRSIQKHIPPSRVKTEKKRYANLPYEQSHPASILDTPPQREIALLFFSSSSFSSSPVTTQTNQCDSLQVIYTKLFHNR